MLAPTDSATPQSPGELRGRCEYLGVNGNSNSSRQCEWIDALRRRRSPAAFRVMYERRDTGEVAGWSTGPHMATSVEGRVGRLAGGECPECKGNYRRPPRETQTVVTGPRGTAGVDPGRGRYNTK